MEKNNILNQMKLVVPSISINEGAVRAVVAAFCAQADPTAVEIADIKCAVSEAITNCIVHGYKDRVGNITVGVKIYSDRTITISIKDKGCGIENVKKAREPLFTTDPEGERSGMGFTVMESFTDKLTVRSSIGKGTSITMCKRLSDIHKKQ